MKISHVNFHFSKKFCVLGLEEALLKDYSKGIMREIPLPNCTREFVQSAASQKQRLDGRPPNEYRQLRIVYGQDRGCCTVHIGDTRVLAQVSSEVIEPKLHRPTDGVLYVNVEMSPMTAPSVEFGRPPEQCVEIQRILERTLKESRCLDLESLCIVSSKQVWQIRVDVHCQNNAGNLLDACSIAGIAALSHFRLPDVTIDGDDVTIHSLTERDPIPLSLHHQPVCCTFAFFSQGKVSLLDPTREEERVMEGKLVVGMNKHREICCLQSAGSNLLMRDQVMRCSNLAVQKVKSITELIQAALDNDREARVSGGKGGSAESAQEADAPGLGAAQDAERLKEMIREENGDSPMEEELSDKDPDPAVETSNTQSQRRKFGLGEGGPSSWQLEEEEMTGVLSSKNVNQSKKDKSSKSENRARNEGKPGRKPAQTAPIPASKPEVYVFDEEEEEEASTLQPDQFTFKVAKKGQKNQKKKAKKKT